MPLRPTCRCGGRVDWSTRTGEGRAEGEGGGGGRELGAETCDTWRPSVPGRLQILLVLQHSVVINSPFFLAVNNSYHGENFLVSENHRRGDDVSRQHKKYKIFPAGLKAEFSRIRIAELIRSPSTAPRFAVVPHLDLRACLRCIEMWPGSAAG